MRLAAAHCLGELENRLGCFALQAAMRLDEQGSHSLGDLVFLEKLRCRNFVAGQVREIENSVTFGNVKDAFSGRAKLLQSFHVVRGAWCESAAAGAMMNCRATGCGVMRLRVRRCRSSGG